MSIHGKDTGVVLMTYGSATTADHVQEYFDRIYDGKASSSLIEDFKNRYRLVGHSPLIEITEAQAILLEKQLGSSYVVRAGMRHSAPYIEDAIAACKAAGATSLVGIILSPQFSSFIMGGYQSDFVQGARKYGFDMNKISIAKSWPAEPHFIEFLVNRIEKMIEQLRRIYDITVPVIFTTHSLPQRVVAEDPQYLEQLATTIDAICKKLSGIEWYAGYQSAGHTPEAWLKPDLVDILRDLHQKKVPAALIVPIQFLSDHLEVLYDLDIAARRQCEEYGIGYHRISLPNTDPVFISALASIVQKVH